MDCIVTSPDPSARAIAIQKDALLGGDPPQPAAGDHPDARARRRLLPAANSLPTAIALSVSAGYIDGFTYLGHGHVFASAMTGNMVLLGIRVATLSPDAFAYLCPILANMTGVIVAHVMMREGMRRRLPLQPHALTLLIEIVVLLGIAYAPIHLADSLLISIITISTAMQNASFRTIGTRTYNSVFMTGNLQAFSNALAAGTHPLTPARLAEARDLGGVLLGFLGGAALGALMTPRLGAHALVGPALLLAVGVALLLAARCRARREDGRGEDALTGDEPGRIAVSLNIPAMAC